MKNLTAQTIIDDSILKKVDHLKVLDIGFENTVVQPIYFGHSTPLEQTHNLLFKRMFDLFLSSILLIFLFSWILPIISLLIKLDSKGPVFFLQKRNKRGGEVFTCIKFRTMLVNKEADSLPACENDQRITQLGWFLRKHHLDELPQLLNVWWGDMALIGPRPHMLSDNLRHEELLDLYSYRHKVKPGITGLAQVRGYVGSAVNLENMKKRVLQDIYYIRHWSMALDVKILYRSICKMVWIN